MIAACGTPPRADVPSNHVAAHPTDQRFSSLAVEEYATCTSPHHLTILVDGVATGTIRVPCAVPPTPHNGVVVIDSSPRTTDGPGFAVPAGLHRVGVHDVETGLTDEHEGRFPIYGALTDPKSAEKARPADTLVVVVHNDWIRADLVVRANLILL